MVSILESYVQTFLIRDINRQSQKSLEVGNLKATLNTLTIHFDVESYRLVHEVIEVTLVVPLVHVEDLVEIKPN